MTTAHPYWPLFDLRIRVGELELRPMTEADQVVLADTLPDDLELDPGATRFDGLPERTNRGLVGLQRYWRSAGTWTPESWLIGFCVFADGVLVGVQELEATDFPTLRTVDSSSYLIPRRRGQGVGKQMRRAVLSLAFGPLGAQAAITSAWHDNHASLAVSRALGYTDNGQSLHRRGDGVDVMRHLLLQRGDWTAGPGPVEVTVTGFEPYRALFGL